MALERELAHGEQEYNGDVRDRLRAQGLATDPSVIHKAGEVLEARGLHLDKKRDFSQGGRWMWWLTPAEAAQMDLDEPPAPTSDDEQPPTQGIVEALDRKYGEQT